MRLHRIFLADDHAETLETIRSILGPHYEIVEIVQDGQALVEAALRLKPDLVITDITMPRLSGILAAQKIKTHLPDVKLLFITIHATTASVEASLEAGGKPIGKLSVGCTKHLFHRACRLGNTIQPFEKCGL